MARKWWTLLAACLATFMLLLDVTVVNVALPDIRRELGGSFTDMQWVVDAYALGLATLLLASGSLADLVGRRLVFVTGIVIFVVGLVRVRAGRLADGAQHRARRAGPGRRDDVRHLAGADRAGVRAERARHRDRAVGRDHRVRRGRRPAWSAA